MAATKRKFKAEVQQILDLVIHSLYTKKEVFLRELISNASDAIDRCRLEALTNKALLADNPEWKIKLSVDKAARTLTISDNGIGMTRDETADNIGTIANSGTRAFLEALNKGEIKDSPELIGQFGVGFYSVFMVADQVTLVTRRAGEQEAVKWESTGDGTYTLDSAERTAHGTDVTLHLREEQAEYLDEWRIRGIVKQYSDYVAYPITMDVERQEPAPEGTPDAKPTTKVREETLNSMKALWKRLRTEVKDEEYNAFYRSVSHDMVDPLRVIPFAAEGTSEFRALLFIPAKAPFDLFFADTRHRSVHLYVRNVFITDECKELLPDYLRFVRGVVDSSDLPLNVSRETLQDNAVIRRIQKSLVNKLLSTLAEMKEKAPEDYVKCWLEFGRILKEGLHLDFPNREKLQELLLYESTGTEPGKFTSLKEYVGRMPSTQTAIYYLCGQGREALANSPYLEALRARQYEVLFFTEAIDEWVANSLGEYEGKKLVAIDRGELALDGDAEKQQREEAKTAAANEFKGLLDLIKDCLKDHVKDVRFSDRLTASACCLVADAEGMNANLERILKAMHQEYQPQKRILELNPQHPILRLMQRLYLHDSSSLKLREYIELLHDQALLAEGSPLRDPARFTRLVTELMVAAAAPAGPSAPAPEAAAPAAAAPPADAKEAPGDPPKG